MESCNNLDFGRELSNSQLEALLGYDSPPETPFQSTDLTTASKGNGEAKTCNSILDYNREQFDSQIGSQIDFSAFQCHTSSSAANWSFGTLNVTTAETEDCINVNSPLKTIEIPDKDERCVEDDTFMANTFDINFSAATQVVHEKADSVVANISSSVKQKYHDFEQVEDIFQTIEFDNNLERDSQNCVLRKYQTQLEAQTPAKAAPEKCISSCPAKTGNDFVLPHISTYSEAANELSAAANLFTPSNERTANTAFTIIDDELFGKAQSEFNFGCSNSLQKQTQAQDCDSLWRLFAEDISNNSNKSQAIVSAPKSLAKLNMLVDAALIPQSVKQLYDIVKTNYSDFAFIYALSAQLCQDRVPMECFVTLKIALLLSLVSIGNNENRPPIPIVAITNDTYMTNYLMTNIGQLGSRFLGPMDDTKSFATADCMEADSIILARGGVLYAGDWTRLKLRRAETIFKNIECSSVAVEKSSISLPLETAIWTHWRSFKYGAKDQQTFNKFLKIFGIPIFVSDDNHEALVDYILDQASVRVFESTIDHLSIGPDDMRNFLICVSQTNVDLSPEAANLLRDYFVASRSMRQDCLSKQSYAMLKQFAESFAKLSMRKVVLTGDALAAIIMCEHFIENVFSPGDYCPPHFGKFDFVGSVDEYLSQFKEWLDSYIKKSQTKS